MTARLVGTTNTAGALSVRSVPVEWGINSVMVRRVGYTPLVGMLWVDEPEGRSLLDGVMQRPALDLLAVVVTDRIIFAYGRMRDSWLRREHGMGRFIAQDDIERRRPDVVSDLLFAVLGLGVRRAGGTTRVFSTRGQRCGPSVWIDGAPFLFGGDVDRAVRPGDIADIETYSAYASTPVQFSVPGADRCGAIVIWTK